jgi:hypothetical protein
MLARVSALALAATIAVTASHAGNADHIAVSILGVLAPQRLPPIPDATHELRLSAYAFHGTRWEAATIEQALVASARLLAPCAVALVRAELRLIDAPRRFHYYYTPDSRRLMRAIDAPRPALFFVEDTKNDPAFDAEAIGVANAKTRPELANTVWIAYGARDLPLAIAHELVHLLSDSGEHSDEPGNLMRTRTAPGSDQLTPAQCERLRLRGEANGLLKSRPR